SKGNEKPYYMGCYGIGVGRTLATIVEKYHDDRGMMWPASVAPYQVYLVSLKENEKAEKVYKELIDAGIEVLYDDREDISAGQKFADADLIGIPVRLVISAKTADKTEFKKRTEKETELLSLEEVLKRLKK
ncbi:MAG: His/Gly/Thr/Pro-type tRNA ligase C-terminal domain-containing protein, partial [Candidatus Levyibacteriota bacterium]